MIGLYDPIIIGLAPMWLPQELTLLKLTATSCPAAFPTILTLLLKTAKFAHLTKALLHIAGAMQKCCVVGDIDFTFGVAIILPGKDYLTFLFTP